jgi:IS5 family transposase
MDKLFFTAEDLTRNLEKAKQISSSLDRLNDRIPWEIFRPVLDRVLKKEKEAGKGPGGRPEFDRVLMFKVTLLQRFFNLSDAQTEMQILDRLSFQRFLGLQIGQGVPDEKTIWLFKSKLAQAKADKLLFKEFDRYLKDQKIRFEGGLIVDSSFIEMPRQHLSEEERAAVAQGERPQGWDKPQNQAKVRQKDTDATWTKKYSRPYYGYKDHIKIDAQNKLILDYAVTTASVHDSSVLRKLIGQDDRGQPVWADSAYEGVENMLHLALYRQPNNIHERAYRNTPLTEQQKTENRKRSKVRSRIEHVFGFMENSMHGMRLRTIGQTRTSLGIGLMNLVYNLFRYEQLVRI